MIDDKGRLDFSLLGMEAHTLYTRIAEYIRVNRRGKDSFVYYVSMREAAATVADSAIIHNRQEWVDRAIAYLDGDDSGVRELIDGGLTLFGVSIYLEDET